MKALFPAGYLVIFFATIGIMYLFPKHILLIFGIMAVVSIAWTVSTILTSEELPKDMTEDESYDLFNVNTKKK